VDDQIDQAREPREDEQEDDPDRLDPAGLFAVAEQIPDDHPQHDEVRNECEADDDVPDDVHELHTHTPGSSRTTLRDENCGIRRISPVNGFVLVEHSELYLSGECGNCPKRYLRDELSG